MSMKAKITALVLAAGTLCSTALHAQSELSALSALSILPVASVVGTASAAAGASVALPALVLTVGSVLVVQAIEAGVYGSVYVLERASDGARVSIEISGRAGQASAAAVGQAVTVTVLASGVLLSTAAEVIAFLPNALGEALLYNERLK